MSSEPQLVRDLRRAPLPEAERALLDFICELVVEFSDLVTPEDVGPDVSFLELGFDSLTAIDFKDLLEERLGQPLETTLAFNCPTPAHLVEYLLGDVLGLAEEPGPETDPEAAPGLRGERALEPVAIVGMACRLPGGATDHARFWGLLVEGSDAIVEVPQERWDLEELYDPDHERPGKIATRHGGFLRDPVDGFDAPLFGISPKEAAELDPQQRLLLEVAWEVMEDAGIAPEAMRGTNTGVFIGLRESEYYATESVRAMPGAYYGTGNALSTASGRISYTFGLDGPCLSLDTACSSSMVALHLAFQSIRRGECDAALAGGVTLMLDPLTTMSLSQANMQAPDGRCKTFDAKADGYVRGEGCGLLLLKPLSRARADGDEVLALVRGSATNQDGASGGLTVPHGPAQERVIRAALTDAGLEPGQVGYVEAHGTGTSLGDPIEVGALDGVFAPGRSADDPLWVGSVKTNIGHLETVSGAASLIKLVLMLRNGSMPPHLNCDEPSPHIPWEQSVVRVPHEGRAWLRGERERIAGASSFGFSGSNAHVIVSEAPAGERSEPAAPRAPELVPLSGFTATALEAAAGRLAEALEGGAAPALGDLAYTAGVGRAGLGHRLAVTAGESAELGAILRAVAAGQTPPGVARAKAPRLAPGVAFLFTGQGSQVAGMGRDLYAREPVFRETLDRCRGALDPLLDAPLLEVMWGSRSDLLAQTEYTQPALFALGLALAETWRSFGIAPAQMLGHSVGEYAAACLGGVFSLEDGCKLIAARGRLMRERTAPGDMLVCFASEAEVRPLLAGRADAVSIAVVNGPRNTVVSGESGAVRAVGVELAERGIQVRPLEVSRAFHSALMEPMLADFEAVARSIEYRAPSLGFVSCLDPGPAREGLATPEYWVRHVREPVRFLEGMTALEETGCDVLLEIGPQPHLLGMARRFLDAGERRWLPSLRAGQPEARVMLAALGELYTGGVSVDWAGVHAGQGRRRVAIPHYPYERKRCWFEAPRARRRRGAGGAHPLLGERVRSPLSRDGERQHERTVSADDPAFLAEHVVFDAAVVPGAAYLECCLAAARSALSTCDLELRNVAFQSPLAVGDAEIRLATVLSPAVDGGQEARVFSLTPSEGGEEEAAWVLHAAGRVAPRGSAELSGELDEARARCADELAVEEFYSSISEAGLDYGPAFRGVRQLFVGPREALARIEVPRDVAGADECVLHPAFSDACFQLSAAVLRDRMAEDTYLPVGVDRLAVLRRPGLTGWCHIRVREPSRAEGESSDDRVATLDLWIWDDAAELAVVVEGLRLARVSRAALLGDGDAVDGWLHEIEWVSSLRAAGAGSAGPPGAWLVVGGGEAGRVLAARLEERGAAARAVAAVDTDTLADDLTGIVHLAALEARADPTDWSATQRALCGSALELVQAVVARGPSPAPRLWLVTRGAQPAGGVPEPLDVDAATLWGLGGTLALEHPDLRATLLDLDPGPASGRGGQDELERLADELLAPDDETRLAFRAGERRAARLVPQGARLGKPLARPGEGPFRLETRAPGVFENLRLARLVRTAPGSGEVEVEVDAAGLNFKDTLLALGMLEGLEPDLGFEVAGRVARVGPGVDHVAVGDDVMASPAGGMQSFVTVPSHVVTRRPTTLTALEAAGVQTVFLTAVYALRRLADLRPGERVLVHAATGGVGLAALQLARLAGAEVHATASRAKWPFLRALGVERVYDSRSTDYADEIRADTDGRGVEVVLNSLANEHIEASLSCLADGGRFVEIGKLGVWDADRMAAARPDVAYHVFDMTEVRDQEFELYGGLLEEVARGFETGELEPLPSRVFSIRYAVAAFTHLAQARHVGKVVLSLPPVDEARRGPRPGDVRPDRTVLITGGLGALGLATARRLVADGARNLLLCARRAPDEAAAAAIAELEAEGAAVRSAAVDVSDRAALAALLEEVDASSAPLGGVVHCAGVLDDGTLQNLDWSRFETVFAPKLAGARWLHELVGERRLDLFVCFSSMASLLGSAGQASYAAANAYLDALACHRRALGRAGTSVCWGPWAGAGMAAELSEQDGARLSGLGLGTIASDEGVEALARILDRDRAQVGVLPIRWERWLGSYGAAGPPPFLGRLMPSRRSVAPATAAIREELEAAPPQERKELLRVHVAGELAAALGAGSLDDMDPDREFLEMGVDSLIAVDLKNRLEASLAVSLPATLLFDHPTLNALVALLEQEVLGEGAAATDEELLAAVEGMPDEEVERLLAER